MSNTFKASILFKGDRSVGINPRVYHMDLDEAMEQPFKEDAELREEYRREIKKFYESMDDETCVVAFSFESFD